MPALQAVLTEAVTVFLTGVRASLPALLTALVVLALASVAIEAVARLLRAILGRFYAPEEDLVVDFGVLVARIVLWFAAGLAVLSILGLDEVAASLGTAAGFTALGVSYALSNMIADTVAGLYLLRDPDFNPGDTVTTADVTGRVLEVGLRKSRLELDDGDVVVLANAAVEKRWRLESTR